MGRPAAISDKGLRAAAAKVAARLGPSRATVEAIAKEAKVPVGSVYHRVPSRAALMAEVWIEAADRFGALFREQLEAAKSLDQAIEAALVTPRFAREDPAGGVILFVNRREDYLTDAPEEARNRAASLNSALQDALGQAARRLLPSDRRGRERLAVALIGLPYGAVRIFLPQAMPPKELDSVIVAAARAALAQLQ
jgi:AcrR family transcriptional regulator